MPSARLRIPRGHRQTIRAFLRAAGVRVADSGDRAIWRGQTPPLMDDLLARGWAALELDDLHALIQRAIARHGSPTAAARVIGVTYRTLRHWLTGASEPTGAWTIRRLRRAAGLRSSPSEKPTEMP